MRGITVTPTGSRRTASPRSSRQFPTEAEFQKALTEQQDDAGAARRRTAPRSAARQDDRGRSGPEGHGDAAGPGRLLQGQPRSVQGAGDGPREPHPDSRLRPVPRPSSKQAARTEADGVLKRAKAGEDFAALAKQFSKDSGSAAVGGDLNYFPKGQMVPPFDRPRPARSSRARSATSSRRSSASTSSS